MDTFYDTVLVPVLVVLLGVAILAFLGGVLFSIHMLLTAPMRRAERAHLFLEIIEVALDRGQPVEEGLIYLSQRRGKVLSGQFAPLATALQRGQRLGDAIAAVPRLLPPQITAMLKAGQQIGDLRKVLPACKHVLKDAVSHTRGATNYVVALAFVVTPALLSLFALILVKVLPSLHAIKEGMGVPSGAQLTFLSEYGLAMALTLCVPVILLWFAAFLYVAGPRAVEWFPVLHQIYFRMPARQKRMLRDFSNMLAILLDADVPETTAVTLAADCTANRVFRTRAKEISANLERGLKLTEAVAALDGSGEFRWRLRNAAHGPNGFRAALAGYENGKVDFGTLIEAQKQIRLARQNRIKAQAEAQIRLAEIERLLGEEL